MDTNVRIQDTTANPAPLGLLGFSMTTVLLNLHNAGLFPLNAMIMAMGIFYGGLAGLLILPKLGWGTEPTDSSIISYFVVWGL